MLKQQLTAFSFVFFLFFATTAHAETLTIDQPLAYAGLTFAQPLTFSDSTSSLQTRSLVFGAQKDQKTTATEETLTVVLPTPDTPLEQAIIQQPPLQPTPTEIATPTPTVLPSPTPTVIPSVTSTPTPIPQVPSTGTGLNADKLFAMVNSYRSSKGLSSLQKDDKSCQLAVSRAPEIAQEVSSGTMHQGLRDRNLAYWNTENIISMNSEEGALNWWLNDQIHKEAIEGNYTYSCLACSGNSCAQEFTNYQTK